MYGHRRTLNEPVQTLTGDSLMVEHWFLFVRPEDIGSTPVTLFKATSTNSATRMAVIRAGDVMRYLEERVKQVNSSLVT